ncbi:MAG: DNA repair protein RadA [Rhodospirillales bacterium]|nr:DNA repair protein RadA [Alphaproteobacteria bacterium]MBL6947542.1 DNA repair protein RadA [Rhodospirillales bacterium]
MARKAVNYVCQECGASSTKWSGRCEGCGQWNTLAEEAALEATPKGLGAKKGRKIQFQGLRGKSEHPPRQISGIKEFDRVTGGGMVQGSALLVGGDPGIGKSTLLMQVAAELSGSLKTAYISGEEAIDQLRLRADRLGVADADVALAAATSVRDIVSSLGEAGGPDLVIIDSIQTMFVDSLDSAPGTVAQVRTSAQELIRLAKRSGFALILVGHVTKDGQIAGPRILEHMVDTVLYFEGDRSHQFRILRSVKNRFGATDEIGVFEMTGAGLSEVENPSALFLADREDEISGASVFAGMEGSRPLLVEIQALTSPSALGTPRRAVVGWDSARLAMILAVLETRSGLSLSAMDVFLNVAGGLKINEPAADLAVAAALISSVSGVPMPPETVIFGEIGLSGEIRSVPQINARLKEASKLGFSRAIVPTPPRPQKNNKKNGNGNTANGGESGLQITEVSRMEDLLALFAQPDGKRGKPQASAEPPAGLTAGLPPGQAHG